MPENAGDLTHTRRLSRAIDGAYKAYKAGKPESEARLYEAFQAQARNIIWQRLGVAYRTLELDISHRALMALVGFRGGSRLSTWFYRLAANQVKRALKYRIVERKRFVPLVDANQNGEERELEVEAKPVNHDAGIDLDKLCRQLPLEQASLMAQLREGYTLEEVAQKAGIPVGTLRSRYRLAKKKLRNPHCGPKAQRLW